MAMHAVRTRRMRSTNYSYCSNRISPLLHHASRLLRIRWCEALLLLVVLGWAASAPAQEMDCLSCHGDSSFATTDSTGHTRSLFVTPEHLQNSVHAGFDCITCHADIKEIPHPEKLASAACNTCHEDAWQAVAGSVHGMASSTGAARSEAPTCGACHGSHDIRVKSDSLSWVNSRREAFTCGTCHADPDFVQRHQIPIKNPLAAYEHSVHGRLAIAGVDSAATCSSCHDHHNILAANQPASRVFAANIPQTCGQCHRAIAAEFAQSVHGVAVARGSRDAPVCTNCHSEHAIESPAVASAPTSPQNIAVETCGQCHASTRIAIKYGIRTERISTFSDSYHGLALRSGQLAAANCGSCHGVHNILPSRDPRSTINPNHLVQTCGRCHPNASSNFARGPVHITRDVGEGRTVTVIRQVYIGLIFVLIGGMLLHNGLDFIRKSKHVLRRD